VFGLLNSPKTASATLAFQHLHINQYNISEFALPSLKKPILQAG